MAVRVPTLEKVRKAPRPLRIFSVRVETPRRVYLRAQGSITGDRFTVADRRGVELEGWDVADLAYLHPDRPGLGYRVTAVGGEVVEVGLAGGCTCHGMSVTEKEDAG